MRRAPKPGFLLVAKREWRWLLHDRAALILIFGVRIPALADRLITVEVRLIATKGEYASWRATRATGDFDLRTFSIRAYPVEKVPELRPGMSAYLEWQQRR